MGVQVSLLAFLYKLTSILKMKIFLDTADTELIRKYNETGLIDGVTTNPTLIMKSGRDPEDVYGNNELAFNVAEQHLGIPALLDPQVSY